MASELRRIGFIGLGSQGGPMAEMIVRAGWSLTVWARRPEALAPFLEAGAEAAATPAELGRACDFVGVCVFTDDDVDAVVIKQGLLDAMAPGSVLAIHATVRPSTVEAIAATAADRGVHVLDAPVSGGSAEAYKGSLAVMVGGDAEVLERVRPAMATYGSPITRVGPVGAGQLLKLVNNALFTANVGLANAALDVAEALGLERDASHQMLQATSGRSFALPSAPHFRIPAGEHGARMLQKDVAILREVAQARSIDAGLLDRVATEVLDTFTPTR